MYSFLLLYIINILYNMKTIVQYITESGGEWTWDSECNKDGKISAEIMRISAGGRECDRAYFELEKLDEDDDYYQVKAVCINSELRKIKKDYELEFDLPKDIDVWDIDSCLEDAIKDDMNYGGRG